MKLSDALTRPITHPKYSISSRNSKKLTCRENTGRIANVIFSKKTVQTGLYSITAFVMISYGFFHLVVKYVNYLALQRGAAFSPGYRN